MARQKRRTFSAELKFKTVLETLKGEKSAAQICREREINENLLSRWKQEFLQVGAELFRIVSLLPSQSAICIANLRETKT